MAAPTSLYNLSGTGRDKVTTVIRQRYWLYNMPKSMFLFYSEHFHRRKKNSRQNFDLRPANIPAPQPDDISYSRHTMTAGYGNGFITDKFYHYLGTRDLPLIMERSNRYHVSEIW